MKPLPAFVFATVLSACRASRTPVAPVQPSEAISVVSSSLDATVFDTTPDTVRAPDGVPVDGPPTEGSTELLVARIHALAEGIEPLARAVDESRGLVIVRYLEAPPSGRGGTRRSAQRLCGTTLVRSAERVRQDLTAALEQAAHNDGFVCSSSHVCVVRGMEHQPDWRVFFEEQGGVLVWTGLAQVSVAAMHPSWVAEVEAYIANAFADARRRPCRPGAP